MTCIEDRSKVRRLRNTLIKRGDLIKDMPKSATNEAYIRGLEYALKAINKEFGDVF